MPAASSPPAIQHRYPADSSHCYGCGSRNPHGHQLESRWAGDEVVARFLPLAHHISLPGFVYGGLLASLIDCHAIATAAATAARSAGLADDQPVPRYVTAALDVRFLLPTPLGPTLELRARVTDSSPRKSIVEVLLYANDSCTVRGNVVAVPMPASMLRPASPAGPPGL